MNIEKLFTPGSVAVIGASRDPSSVGQGILRNLALGCVLRTEYCKPFPGKIFPVNPAASELLGMRCFPSLSAIKEPVDLAIISIPARAVLVAVKDCIRKKVGAVIIVSAGFSEAGTRGKRLQEQVVSLLTQHDIPLLGPNCLGMMNISASLNASFAPGTPPAGSVAFVSQSGALVDSVVDWSWDSHYGFSKVISYGNKAMLDCPVFLEYCGNDRATRAIALYIEGVSDGRKFMEVAFKVARMKPIVALKGGSTALGNTAVSSHTASLAGDSRVYSAAFRQSGIIQAATVEELFDVAKVLSTQPPCENRIVVVTNGGGAGVLAADYCENLGVQLVPLKEPTLKKLDRTKQMHPAYSRRNPLDLVGDATAERYAAALDILLADFSCAGVIVIQTLQTMTRPIDTAKAIELAAKKHPDKPIVCSFLGGRFSNSGVRYLEAAGIPNVPDVRRAVVSMHALIERKKFLQKN
jgi:acetate---CoA ligase (ADP-forming)